MTTPLLDDLSMRRELARRLAEIPELSILEDALDRRPTFEMDLLVEPSSLAKFLSIFDWVLSEIRSRETL